MRIGIFGGSFNPIHKGHIYLAQTAMDQLKLDKVILVPSNIPPHKSSKEYAKSEDRLEMCKLAIEEKENFSVSSFELECDRVSYTYYTIQHFKEICPDDELFLIMGSDMFLSFETWFRYKDILADVSLAVASREDGLWEEIESQKKKLGEYGGIYTFNIKPLPMSSTKIREMIKNNVDISCYLNKKVVKYIVDKNLYRN